ETAPEHQLAFQAELGNHPSFDEMQILVVREKHRPRFPDAWKDNSPVLRSLKETMEDCWDQDAEARLTAQCAEERLTELTLLSTHTAIHNNRNLSPRVGSASFHIEDLQVGVVKNLQGDPHLPSVVKATTSGAEERNRKLINYERQKSQARLSSLDAPPSLMPATVPESELRRGTVSVCLQLTEEDLDATKLDPRKVDKNLRENSDENLMEHSQKQFSSHPQITNLLSPAPQTNQVNNSVSTHHSELGGVDAPPSSSIQPLPKQQNLPKRPTSLHLLPKTMETLSASSRRKLEKLKSNHRQVEMGVAKMNTVPVATAAEPHLVTTVTNTSSTRGSVGNLVQSITLAASRYSGGVPSLLTNSMVPGGRTNPAGPRLEDEDSVEEGTITREDSHLNLLNFSPDEDEPLLRRGQPPDKSRDLPHQSRASGRGSNSNNNNNRTVVGAEVKIQDPEVPAERMKGSEVVQVRDLISPKPEQINGAPATQAQDPAPKLPTLSNVLGVETQTDAEDPASDPAPESQDLETTAPNEASDPEPTSIDQKEQTRTSRPERPCSLDLSFPSSDDVSLTDNVSASGEKIKRRVKTPYTLKRWRPASWVVTTDTALDPDFGFDSDGVNVRTRVSPSRARRLPKLSQSRSSMAVFWNHWFRSVSIGPRTFGLYRTKDPERQLSHIFFCESVNVSEGTRTCGGRRGFDPIWLQTSLMVGSAPRWMLVNPIEALQWFAPGDVETDPLHHVAAALCLGGANVWGKEKRRWSNDGGDEDLNHLKERALRLDSRAGVDLLDARGQEMFQEADPAVLFQTQRS
ncbi:unnamed protein product, partial [Pleuronectes platessa]